MLHRLFQFNTDALRCPVQPAPGALVAPLPPCSPPIPGHTPASILILSQQNVGEFGEQRDFRKALMEAFFLGQNLFGPAGSCRDNITKEMVEV